MKVSHAKKSIKLEDNISKNQFRFFENCNILENQLVHNCGWSKMSESYFHFDLKQKKLRFPIRIERFGTNIIHVICKQTVRDFILETEPDCSDEVVNEIFQKMECRVKHQTLPYYRSNNKVALLIVHWENDYTKLVR